MPSSDVPHLVQQLVLRALPTVDHVAVLLALRTAHQSRTDPWVETAELAKLAAISLPVARTVLADLHAAGLVRQDGPRFTFDAPTELIESVDALAAMYNTRPVTLVRAIYDRAASALRPFSVIGIHLLLSGLS